MSDDPILEDLKDFEFDPSKGPRSKFSKFIVLVIVLFLVALVFSFVFVTFPIDNIIASIIESKVLDDNVISLDDFSIVFEDSSEDVLQDWYFAEQRVEFSACLLGFKKSGDYHITDLYKPKMFSQSYDHVSFESCSKDTLILFHTHPYKSCLASPTDLNTLEKTQKVNPDMIMVIMCEPERFSVYS